MTSILVVLLCSLSLGYTQRLNRTDFKVGVLDLDVPFDSIVSLLGKRDSVKTFDKENDFNEWTAHYYQKMVVWRGNQDGKIWAFDIYDTSYITNRGLRVGDSIGKIEKLYGVREWVDKEFSRSGPYDYSFKDYSEVTILEYYDKGWFFIVFTKGKEIVKMLFYIGVYE